MSHVLSLRVPEELLERLDRFARRHGNGMTRTRAGAMLLDEALREADFANIEFRTSAIGQRRACMKGSGLAVWEVIWIAQQYDMDVAETAAYFQRPEEWVRAALHYYESFPDEIDVQIADNQSVTFEDLKRKLPHIERFLVPIGDSATFSK